MMKRLRQLASLRLTLVGMALLGVGAALSYDNPVSTPVWVLICPLALLAVNLFAAILSNPHINRRGGLLLFHVGLLLIVILAAVGRLTRMDGRIELTEGGAFAPEDLTDVHQGIWHTGALDRVLGRKERVTLVVSHEIAVRYAVNAAAGSDDPNAPLRLVANAAPYVFDDASLGLATRRIRELAGS